MASPPDAHENSSHGAVYGQMVQARDIHGGVTINVPSAPVAPSSDVSLDPPRLATAVRGRDDLLHTLGEAMAAGAPVPHVLTGPGGFGKTTVAAALAERARSDGWTVFWVRPGSVTASMLEAAIELGGPREEADRLRGTRRQAARWVWRHLDEAPRPWLLVIDNADRPEELDPDNRVGDQLGWMRASPGGFVLVTSRVDDPALWAPAEVHRIGELDAVSATTALADHAGLPDLPGADVLAERLSGVPLALSLAGRILATHRVVFPDAHALLDRLDQNFGELDQLAAPFVTGRDTDRRLLSNVWDLSLRLVTEKDAFAAPLLRLLAILGPEAREVPLRRLPLSELGGGSFDGLDEAAFARTINALVIHGLVTVTNQQEEVSLWLHPLVSETIRAGFTANDVPFLRTAEQLLSRVRGRDLLLESMSHWALSRLYERLVPEQPGASVVMSIAAARALIHLGEFGESARIFTRLAAVAENSLGDTHPITLTARHHLGEALQKANDLDTAEAIHRDVLAAREATLGQDHPAVLDSRHQLAMIHGERGDWAAAEVESRAVLEARMRQEGPEQRATQAAMENLAFVIMSRGDLTSAESMFREVWAIRTRVWGEQHPLTAQAEFYVGLNLLEQGNTHLAQDAFKNALLVWTRTLGSDHPDTRLAREQLGEATRRLREA
ncbi:tetratricopeptide repeat protein [Nocardiopsis sp. NPDC049922]|uniref:tetratricopeptide repeat protein n=1 Tax=Nocardiopsis sp. NPDC049922 TaxID=3155157 RepID=UPI0034093A48